MATITTVWMGMPTPSTREGSTSETPSLPSVATSRLAQPGEARRVEPGGEAAGVPGPMRSAPGPAPGAHDQCVARPHPQTRLLLGRLEVLGEDGFAGLERVDAAQRGDVEQHAPGDDAVVQSVDAELGCPMGGDRRRRGSRCRASPRGRCGTARRGGSWRSRGGKWRSSPPPCPSVAVPVMWCATGRGIVGRGHGVEGAGTRHRPARAHRGRRGRGDLRGDQVQCPELVLVAPAAPVGEGLMEGQDVGGCHGVAGHGRRVARSPLRSAHDDTPR